MSARRKPTPGEARERRARIAVVVLSVVFVGVLALEVPKVLKQLHHGEAAATAPLTTTTSLATALAPAPGTAALAEATVPSARLPTLRRFALKDPFRQQLQPAASPAAKPAAAPAAKPKAPAAPKPKPTPKPPAPVRASAPPTTSVTFQSAPAPNPLARPGVLLLLDGRRQGLLRGDLFPAHDPVFKLVGFTPTAARLALVGGTLSGGGQVLTLPAGHRVVLRDATTGTRYVLQFARVALVVPRPSAPPQG